MEQIDYLCDQLNLDQFSKVPIIKKGSKLSGLKHKHFLLIIFALMLVSAVSTKIGMWFVSSLGSFLIPCYMSYKALESDELEEQKTWLIYWIVFSFIHYFDEIFKMALFFVPFYPLLRSLLMVYIYHIKKGGIRLVYDRYIVKAFSKLEAITRNSIQTFEDIAEMKEIGSADN